MRLMLFCALIAAIGSSGCSDVGNGDAGSSGGSAGTSSGGSAGTTNGGSAGASGSGGTAGGSGGNQPVGGSGGTAGVSGDVCAKQSKEQTEDGHEVIRCQELFDAAPLVHLPALTTGRQFATLSFEGFTDAEGVVHAALLSEDEQSAEMDRHASAVYLIELSGQDVISFEPWLLFDERVFLVPFADRVVEGFVSRRTGEGSYEFEAMLPVRGVVSMDEAGQSLGIEILNLNAAVTAADGTCMPSLSSAGAENPFDEAVPASLYGSRTASMHVFADDTFVLGSSGFAGTLMGGGWFLGPRDVLDNELDGNQSLGAYGHGAPGTAPTVALEPVSGGGEACTP
jgi:hypothetical protein